MPGQSRNTLVNDVAQRWEIPDIGRHPPVESLDRLDRLRGTAQVLGVKCGRLR
jgi:hypothetical protein